MVIKKMNLPKLKKNSDSLPYECHYCLKRFKREGNFLNHKCKDMRREELLGTINGEAAWLMYKDWMKLCGRRVHTKKSFIRSRFFNAFIDFYKYSLKLRIPRKDLFMKFMVDNKFPPTMWAMDKVYGQYISYLDYKVDPIVHVKISLETLDTLADTFNCSIEDVFDKIYHGEIIKLLQQRQLSPWLLIHSPKFLLFVKNASTEHEMILQSYIPLSIWQKKINKLSSKKREFIRNLVSRLNL